MIYVYTPRKSDGARQIVNWLNENDGDAMRLRGKPDAPDDGLFVNWGSLWPKHIKGFHVLNAQVIHNKYKELQVLSNAGVECVESSLTPKADWLVRKFKHQGANDLLAGLTVGDYYTKYRECCQEFRVHIFQNKSSG